jgi:glyoxylase-like metal-dependent hydrolase (beta-lactamase superfamily II)
VTVASDGDIPWAPGYPVSDHEYRAAAHDADAEGRVPLGLNSCHIAVDGVSIVVDPSVWDEEMIGHFPGYRPAPGLLAALPALGVDAGRVTDVLITHGHLDHFTGVSGGDGDRLRFPNARHLLGRADWERVRHRGHPLFDRNLGAAERRGRLRLLDAELEVAPGVRMIPAPGESPGHSVVRVASEGAVFYFLGDLVHHAVEFDHPDWVPHPHQRLPEVMLETRRRLYPRIAAEGAVVVFSHAPFPPWGLLVESEGRFRLVPG